jgi:hypothetical protein
MYLIILGTLLGTLIIAFSKRSAVLWQQALEQQKQHYSIIYLQIVLIIIGIGIICASVYFGIKSL